MGRRSFEHRGRLENTREIMRKRERFLGENSDLPANEIDRNHQVEVQNGLLFDNYAIARPGILDPAWATYEALPVGLTAITASQSGTTVTVTAGITLSSSDIGRLICFAPTSNATYLVVKVLSIGGGTTCTVDVSQTVASTSGYIRNEVNGWIHSDFASCFIVHTSTKLYKISDTGTGWTEISPIGTAITNVKSYIDLLDNKIVIFAAGVWLVDIVNGYYFKANNSPTVLGMTAGTDYLPGDTRYNRRYLITKSRLTGTLPIFNDRSSLVIEHETGSSTVDTGSDFVEIGADNKTGSSVYNSSIRFKQSLNSSVNVVDHDVCFAITVNGTEYIISFHHNGGWGTWWEAGNLAREISIQFDTVLGQAGIQWSNFPVGNQQYIIDSDGSTQFNFNRQLDIGYFTTPSTIPSGYTDISGAGYLNAASASSPQYAKLWKDFYNTGKIISNVGFATNNDPYTHYSLYGTMDYQVSSGLNADNINDFAWLDDIPIMKSMTVAVDAAVAGVSVITAASPGTFTKRDLHRTLKIMNNANQRYYFGAITTFTSSTEVKVRWTGTLYDPGAIASASAIIGGSVFVIGSIVNGACPTPMTVSLVYTAGTAQNQLLVDIHSSWSGWSVGQQIFSPDGNIVYVQTRTNANSYIVTGSAITAVTNGVFSYSPALDSYYDNYEDADISPRIGTLSIASRFMKAVPSTSLGLIADGFLFCAETNNYYWSQLPNGKKYLICNYDPYNQTSKFPDTVTGFSRHPNIVCVFSKSKTTQIPTNLDGNVDIGGNTVFVLPNYAIISNSYGINTQREICYISEGNCAILNQDNSIRSFDGYKYSNPPVTLDSIEKKFALLYNRMVAFDPNLGLIVIGATSSSYDYNNKMYYFGLGGKMPTGAGEFTQVPLMELNVPPLLKSASLYMLSGGYLYYSTTIRDYPMNNIIIFDYDATQDYTSVAHGGGISTFNIYDIIWSLTESDDIGENQSYTIDHLESHISLSPTTGSLPFPTGLEVTSTLYNDIGAEVTKILKATTDTDLVAATKICGHRIRKKWAFNMAGVILNDTLSYYKVNDKVNYVQSEAHVLGDFLVACVAGFTRGYVANIGLGDNIALDVYGPSLTLITTKTILNVTGPDSISNSAYFIEDNPNSPAIGGQCYIHDKSFSSITGNFTLMFWAKKSAVNLFWVIFLGKNITTNTYLYGSTGALEIHDYQGHTTVSLACTDLSSSTYKHETITYNASTQIVKLYQNGVFVTSNDSCSLIDLSGHIGDDLLVDGGLKSFDVRLLNSVLTAEQILAYYNDVITNGGAIYLPLAV